MTAKKINLLLVRAYAYARERGIIGIFTNSFLDSSIPSLLSAFSTLLLFFSIPPIVCEKQHVVFNKTTRRFQQNNTSFSAKQRVINEFPKIYCVGQHSRKKEHRTRLFFWCLQLWFRTYHLSRLKRWSILL